MLFAQILHLLLETKNLKQHIMIPVIIASALFIQTQSTLDSGGISLTRVSSTGLNVVFRFIDK